MTLPHIPLLRFGRSYESLDVHEVRDARDGSLLARMSLANPGLIRRDLGEIGRAKAALNALSHGELLEICRKAGEYFLNGTLPAGSRGGEQSPEDYVATLSATSGLPRTLCRANMSKIHYVLNDMATVLRGLTRDLDLTVLDRGLVRQNNLNMSYFPATSVLGIVLPSNSPGVNSLWLPAIALKTPVLLKPGSEEPWTPWRLFQALLAAGCPAGALGFYPTTHEGADTIVAGVGRAIVFGDQKTVERHRGRAEINVHGPGYSKVLIGEDQIDRYPAFIEVLADSILLNSGRSCVNASTIIVPRHGRAIAEMLAERLAAVRPIALDHPEARLSAFANPKMAAFIDAAIEADLQVSGAVDLTAKLRGTPRLAELGGSTFLHPTLIYCDSPDHPLAFREFMYPHAAVFELPQSEMVARIGPTLVATAITRDPHFIAGLLGSASIDRLNLGEISTPTVGWDQPHEGNLFEFLYRRRAIQIPQSA